MLMLSSIRSIGVIGSFLTILVIVPGAGSFLSIIGWALILFAVYELSQYGKDRGIFNNVLIAAILAIAGAVAAAVVVLGALLSFLGLSGIEGLVSLGRTGVAQIPAGSSSNLFGFLLTALGGILLLWVFVLASAFFLRRGYDRIAGRFGVKTFGTAALVYLIGAALTVILIGLVVILVAEIIQAYAFYSLPDELPEREERPAPMTVPPPPPPYNPSA